MIDRRTRGERSADTQIQINHGSPVDHEWRVNEMRLDQILLPNSLQKKVVESSRNSPTKATWAWLLTLKGYSITRMVFWDWGSILEAEEVEANCLPCQINTEPRSYDHPRNTKCKTYTAIIRGFIFGQWVLILRFFSVRPLTHLA
jgi:hypothetical protein